jgi:acyl-CoA synthetase (NDP forming)
VPNIEPGRSTALVRREGPAIDLTPLLRPRSIAVVGASDQEGSFGRRLLDAVTGWRYTGSVYPVNPRRAEVLGRPCFPSLGALPEAADLVAFAIGDDRVEEGLLEAAAAGARAAVVFGRVWEAEESGRPNRSARLGAIAKEAGILLQGPNCMGFINSIDGLKVTGNPPPVRDRAGKVALLSHSGSSWSGLVGNQRQLDFSFAVSTGMEAGVTMADYLRFLVAQPETRAIGCILETVRDVEGFVAALAAAEERRVPIAMLKLGRSPAARRLALAHSGAVAGEQAAYEALFARYGAAACDTLDELADTLEMLASDRAAGAGGLGAVTDSGGERELLVDVAGTAGCPLPELGPDTLAALEAVLDPGMSPANPVDSYGDGRLLYRECLDLVAADPGIAVVALSTNLVHGRPRTLNAAREAIAGARAATEKPVILVSNVSSAVSAETAETLRDAGIPVLLGTSSGLRAITSFLHFHQRRRSTSPASPQRLPLGPWRDRLRGAGGPLDLGASLELIADFGVPIAAWAPAGSAEEAVARAAELGYPVVLKAAGPGVLHKTELDAVATGLSSSAAVAAAYDDIARRAGPIVAVQAQAAGTAEVFLGMVRDPQLGPLLTIGIGGVFVEVYHDVVSVIPPIDPEAALEQLRRLRGFPLLAGVRGRPGADLDRLARVVADFSRLCAALGDDLEEVDVNPVIVGPDGALAVDALVVPRAAAGADTAASQPIRAE